MDKNYCRFCGDLKPNADLVKIFDKNISDPTKSISLIIFKCFRIKIKPNDSLSKLICSQCCQQTISIMKFYEQILRTQNVLKNLSNGKDKPTPRRSKRSKLKNNFYTVLSEDEDETVKKETPSDDDWNNESVKTENKTIKEEDEATIKREKQNEDDKNKTFVKEEKYNEEYFDSSEITESHDSDFFSSDTKRENQCDLDNVQVKFELKTEDHNLVCLYRQKWYNCPKNNTDKGSVNSNLIFGTIDRYRKKKTKNINNIKREKQQQKIKTESQKKWAEMMKKLDEEYKDYVWKCHICVKELNSKIDLMRHFKTEHKKPPEFSCIDCSKIFTDSAKFRWHVRRHRGVPEFRCAMCDKWFVLACHLKRHMYHVHEQREDQKFMCPKCGKNYKTKTSLQIHDSYVHQKRDDGLECDICHKKFHSKYSFRTHKISHGDRKFICEKCECKFITKHCLTMHIIAKHSDGNTPLVPCPSCSKSFKNSKVLTQHINRMHKGDGFKYECEICGKKERDRSHYKLHLTIHSGELPHACQYCEKKFRLRSTLKVHLRQHTGERPYLCQECDRDFTCFANYLKHKRRKHGDTNKKKDNENV